MDSVIVSTYMNLGFVFYYSLNGFHILICRMCNKEIAISKFKIIAYDEAYSKDEFSHTIDFSMNASQYKLLFNRSKMIEK